MNLFFSIINNKNSKNLKRTRHRNSVQIFLLIDSPVKCNYLFRLKCFSVSLLALCFIYCFMKIVKIFIELLMLKCNGWPSALHIHLSCHSHWWIRQWLCSERSEKQFGFLRKRELLVSISLISMYKFRIVITWFQNFHQKVGYVSNPNLRKLRQEESKLGSD